MLTSHGNDITLAKSQCGLSVIFPAFCPKTRASHATSPTWCRFHVMSAYFGAPPPVLKGLLLLSCWHSNCTWRSCTVSRTWETWTSWELFFLDWAKLMPAVSHYCWAGSAMHWLCTAFPLPRKHAKGRGNRPREPDTGILENAKYHIGYPSIPRNTGKDWSKLP